MKVQVLMLANQPNAGVVREVEIPDDTPDKQVLDKVFEMGQNDFQPIPKIVSVSMGDVIIKVDQLGETPYLIIAGGFRKLSLVELRAYIEMPRRDRVMSAWN